MKTTLLAACLLILSLGTLVAAPYTWGPWPRREGTRPLLRFLVATLKVPANQALEIQHLLKTRTLGTTSPDELATLLRPALTEAQFAKFQDLADSQLLVPSLTYLASLH